MKKTIRILSVALSAAIEFSGFSFIVRAEEENAVYQIYVSENGSDSNSGTETSPFKTIGKAKETIAQLDKTNLNGGAIEVIIREGTYNYQDPLMFNKEDSGTEKNPIYYKAYPGEEVRFTHSDELKGNEFNLVSDENILSRLPDEAKGKVYSINLKEKGITEYGEVEKKEYGKAVNKYIEIYFNNEALKISRYPNDKYMRTGQVTKNTGDVAFICEDERVKNWGEADDAYVYGFWSNGYGDDALKIKDINVETGEISAEGTPYFGIKNDRIFYIYKLLEEIDEPGEYFLDRSRGILYLYPTDDINSADITISTNRNDFLTFDNSEYITFENIIFEQSCGNVASVNYSKCINFRNCTIRNIAGTAITYSGGTDSTVYGCLMYNLGNSGVISYCGDRASLTPGNITVENCHIYKFAQYSKTYTPAVYLHFVGNRIANNVIHDSPHTAILFDGNNNIIENNEIYDVCKETDDCGAIYGGRDWTTYGNIIRNNYFHDIQGPGSQAIGVYLDDMMSGITVENNIFKNVTQPIGVGGGHDNIIRNNIMVDATEFSPACMYYDNRGLQEWFGGQYNANPSEHQLTINLNAVPYTSDVWVEAYPNLAKIFDVDPMLPVRGEITHNIVSNHKNMNIADEVIENGIVEENWVTPDSIGIVRDERGKYSFEDISVFDEFEGFNIIPIEDIGLKDDWQFDIPEEYVVNNVEKEYIIMDAPEVDVTPILQNPQMWDQVTNPPVGENGMLKFASGSTYYSGENYSNFKMRYKIAFNDEVGWSAFMVHSNVTNKAPWEEGRCYLIVIKPDSFELQRWRSESQKMIRTVENVLYPGNNQFTNVEIEIANLEDDAGVSIIFRYHGVEVFNYTDTDDDAITGEGTFGFYGSGGITTLGAYDEQLQAFSGENPYGQGAQTIQENKCKVKINGKFIEFKDEALMEDGFVYAPFETVMETLGAKIYQNNDINAVIALWNDHKLAVKLGSDYIAFDNNVLRAGHNVLKKENVFMISLNDLTSAFGGTFSWDQATMTANVVIK